VSIRETKGVNCQAQDQTQQGTGGEPHRFQGQQREEGDEKRQVYPTAKP
jgi:hypothetical protein